MITIRRLTKRFSKQTLSEVKPAPLSETVDHTVEEDYPLPPHKAFQPPSPSRSPSPLPPPSSPAETDDSCEGESEEEEVLCARVEGQQRRHCLKRRERPSRRELPRHQELVVDRVPSAEKRKYSQYKSGTEASSSASSSDEEVREAFENYLPPVLPALTVGSALWSPAERPIRVPPSGCRKRVPKYFAQMASTDTIERPRLDFNKMQSRRLAMVRKPAVLRHSYSRPLPSMRPSLELTLDFSSHSFQPVPTHT